jgi:phage baseplate assembly protein W
LLLTNYGERLGLTTFGANLRPLVTEYRNKEDFDSEAMARIKQALQTWMPFVVPTGFDSEPQFTENQFTGRIKLVVVYSAPALGLVDSVLEMELFVI